MIFPLFCGIDIDKCTRVAYNNAMIHSPQSGMKDRGRATMKKRFVLLVALLLAASMMLVSCDGMTSGGLIEIIIERLWGDPDNVPGDISQIIESIPPDLTLPEDITLPDDPTWGSTDEPNTNEPNTDAPPTSEPIPDEPYPTPSEGLAFSSNGDGTCSVVGIGSYTDTDLVIPEKSPDGDTVVCIGYEAFRNNKNIRSVVIPDSVVTIDDFSFFECENLTSVVIPNGVERIGFAAFRYCWNLKDVTLSESVTSIGSMAISCCPLLNSITVAKTNPVYESINNCLIEKSSQQLIVGCNTSVIPNGVVSIGDSAFESLCSLQSVVIPASVKNIGEQAFYGCQDLTEVVMENGVQEIGRFAFQNCYNLKHLVIPESLTKIAEPGVFEAGALIDIEVASGNPVYYSVNNCMIEKQSKILILGCQNSIIPNDITGIGAYAFMHCENLTSMVLPDGVTSIGICAFAYTESLESIVIPEGVTEIGEGAFFGCKNIESIVVPDSVTSIGASAFADCSALSNFVLPNGITTLSTGMLSNCWSLKNLVIPSSVTSIQSSFFWGNLEHIYFMGSEAEWDAIDIQTSNDRLLEATVHYNYVPEN